MANTLRFKRGLVATIPTALAGEPLFTTDTFDLYIGNGTTNTRFQKYIASGATTQILRGDGSLYTFPLAISSPSNGQVLKYNGTSWVNDSDSGITGSGSAGQVAYFTGATTQAGSNNLFWDNTNGRLGIGTNTPSQKLDVRDGMVSVQRNTDGSVVNFNIFSGVTPVSAFQINTDQPNLLSIITSRNNYQLVLSTNDTQRARITTAGNFIINNTSTDSGQRLQVTGDTLLKGSGNGSTTYALTVQSANGTQIARFQNGGVTEFDVLNPNNIVLNSNGVISSPTSIFLQVGQGATDGRLTIRRAGNLTTQTGNVDWLAINTSIDTTRSFAPTSGTATMSMIRADIIVNQTGGANGVTRGLFVNPTLTSAADFRAIETSAGNVLFGSNFFWDNTNGRLGIGTNSPIAPLDVATSATTIINRIRTTSTSNSTNVALLFQDGTTGTNSVDGLYLGRSSAINYLWTYETEPLVFGTSNTERVRLFANGNFALNSTTDSGQRLQVNGDTLLKGSGNTSATSALLVQNSGGTELLRLRNDGVLRLSNSFLSLSSSQLFVGIGASNDGFGLLSSGLGLMLFSDARTSAGTNFGFYGADVSNTSGILDHIKTTGGGSNVSVRFNPTSGVGIFNLLNLSAQINQTGGANGITRGLYVNPTLTAAADWRSIEWSNNTGWGLYGAGTSNNFLAGSLGIGTTNLLAVGLAVDRNLTGNIFAVGIRSQGRVQSDVTNTAYGYYAATGTQATTFTLPILIQYASDPGVFGAGSTITNHIGFSASNISAANVTNAFAFQGGMASGTGRWNLYMNGTANNYMAGRLGIGSTSLTDINLRIAGNLSGSVGPSAVLADGTISSTSTTAAGYFFTTARTEAATFTLPSLTHYTAQQATFGAGSTVATQVGFRVNATLTGATTNYAFVGSLAASGTSRWNLFMDGSAPNYFAGVTQIGAGALTSEQLQVNGTAKITGASSFGGNMTLSLNQNAETSISISNTTAGTTAITRINLTSDSTAGSARLFKYSSLNTGYKTIAASDFGIFNITAGDISLLNDFATGNIKFAAGGSSTAHMTIKSNGRINMSSLPTSATGLSAGDLWNDGGTLKIA